MNVSKYGKRGKKYEKSGYIVGYVFWFLGRLTSYSCQLPSQ